MATTLQDAISYIVSAINADSTLTSLGLHGAFMHSAPERQQFPYVIIQKQSGLHEHVICKEAFATHFLAIKCVDTGFDGGNRARTIMERVKELLDHQSPTLGSGYAMAILANNSYEYDEQETGNNNFYHSVINFRVILGQ